MKIENCCISISSSSITLPDGDIWFYIFFASLSPCCSSAIWVFLA